MIIDGRALVISRDNVDTDVLYPGQFVNVLDPVEMTNHLFEGLDPSLRDEITPETVLVAWENFGSGSSRENVPLAMKTAGIQCVVAKSFARIFYRNCFNLGLPAITCPEAAAAARPGSRLRIDVEAGAVEVDGRSYAARPLPSFMLELLDAGGLVPWISGRLADKAS